MVAAAREHGLPVCSHGMRELRVALVSGQGDAGLLEVHAFPIDRYTHRPLTLDEGLAAAPDVPGTGASFDVPTLSRIFDAGP